MIMDALSVSVIIPAFNAEETIGDALAALEAQTCQKPFEILVVDDGSTDATARIVQSYPHVKYLFQPNAGPASARNYGARRATGNILLFTDADCCPEREWVEKMVGGFSDPDIAVVAGGYGIANPGSWLARVIHYEIKYRHHRLMPEFPKAFGSYNFAIRHEVFDAVGGFNAAYRRASGEDNDLSYKVLQRGSRIRFLRSALVDHYHQTKFGKYMKEQFRHGIWRVRMYIDHPVMAAGDDYTFWKDIVEVPAALLSCVAVFFFPPLLFGIGVLFFGTVETVFGIIMMPRPMEGLVAGTVFFLRSYVRAAGFVAGLFKFIIYIFNKQKNLKFPCGTSALC